MARTRASHKRRRIDYAATPDRSERLEIPPHVLSTAEPLSQENTSYGGEQKEELKPFDPKGPRFRLGIDYGTSKTALTAQYIAPTDTKSAKVQNVPVGKGNSLFTMPNVAAYVNGEFLMGGDVLRMWRSQQLDGRHIIRLPKLAIFDDPRTVSTQARVTQQLSELNKDIVDVIADTLKFLIKAAKAWARKNLSTGFFELDNVPLELCLSVPQMWDRSANLIMQAAARRAGVSHCQLVFEPLCAAVQAFAEELEDVDNSDIATILKKGDAMLVADLGAGTGDFVVYELASDPLSSAKIKLQTIDKPEGDLCGSEIVNLQFLQWFQKQKGEHNPRQVAAKLGFTVPDTLARASDAFETIKLDYEFGGQKVHFQIFGGPSGRFRAVESHIFELTCDMMKSFFQVVIDLIEAKITSILNRCSNVKIIILPGGFARSKYLVDNLEAIYGDRGVRFLTPSFHRFLSPVARGTLLLERNPVKGLTSRFAYGVAINEVFDRKKHRDAVLPLPGKPVNPKLVVRDEHEPTQSVVHDRWLGLLRQGVSTDAPTETRRQRVFFIAIPNKDGGPIDLGPVELIYATHEPKNSAPIYKTANEFRDKDNFHEGFALWGAYSILFDAKRAGLGLKMRGGKLSYRVFVEYWFVVQAESVQFRWRLLPKTAKMAKEDHDTESTELPCGSHTVLDEHFVPEPAAVEED